ncbi:hypothetical protein MIC448_60012 [Microbacterium sp. C448]|nr:hypothetical protein MIC448_60012 [Microbacterium sp. C448]
MLFRRTWVGAPVWSRRMFAIQSGRAAERPVPADFCGGVASPCSDRLNCEPDTAQPGSVPDRSHELQTYRLTWSCVAILFAIQSRGCRKKRVCPELQGAVARSVPN